MTPEEVKKLAENFAKYCLRSANAYTSSGCEEISWVIGDIERGEFDKFMKLSPEEQEGNEEFED